MLFKVPRFYFKKNSSIFKDMFALLTANRQVEGTNDANPIKLESIQKVDFQWLLRVMIPE
jgi:hypothetical protein